ncbi:unnamed protein product [Parnassius apollo]|uniref:(apollo) hypothetical protein n=1 Tax=Parnassius apollo TaxID=110799 RepID=A0A8S3Y7P8_PARAO|nr:unnamed protein product [Parnassius apollo]
MHLIYVECQCNDSEAARRYRERYPNADRYPDHRVFTNVHRLLFSDGRLPNQMHGEGRISLPYEEVVLQAVDKDPSCSTHDCTVQNLGCKHGVAFFMWVHRRIEEPSPTEKISYWAKPKQVTIGTKFIKAKDEGLSLVTTEDKTPITMETSFS